MKKYSTLLVKLTYLLSKGTFFEVPVAEWGDCWTDAEVKDFIGRGLKMYCFKPTTGEAGTFRQWAKTPKLPIENAYHLLTTV